jgi:hypothetical protein
MTELAVNAVVFPYPRSFDVSELAKAGHVN